MKIIQHPDTYQCEICGAEYKTKFMAERCESRSSQRKTNIQVGDKVLCQSRYDGYFELTVESIFLQNTWQLQNWEDDDLNRYLPRRQQTLREFIYGIAAQDPHEWFIKTSESIEVCNDGTCSDTWLETEVYACKDIVWNNSYEKFPDLGLGKVCFIRYIKNGKEVISRLGNKNWFDTYWKGKVQFLAFSENVY